MFLIPLVTTDYSLLNNNGIQALSMTAVTGVSTSFPEIIAQANPIRR